MEPSHADRILADWDRISRQTTRPGLPQRRAVTTALPASTITGAALVVVAFVAAGLWFGLPPGTGQPGAQAPASPVEASRSPVGASPSPGEPSASPVELSASPAGTWGPLAVVPPQDGMDTLAVGGTLRITDTCVYLESSGEVLLLLWRADQTTWSAESRAITVDNFDGSVVTVSDGDLVVLGGSGGSEADSGIFGEEFVRRMDWVVPPASSCSLDKWWGVGAIEPPPEPTESS